MTSRDPVYVEADLTIGDRTWRHVGVRYKGNSTLLRSWHDASSTMPLRIEMDQYATKYPETRDQRLFGFEKLSLSNATGDASHVRQKLASDLFEAAGLPTPATALYHVYIDHGDGPVDQGVYTATEMPSDAAFLNRTFGSASGSLYKPEGVGARWQTFDAATLDKQRPSGNSAVTDARALFDALHADRKTDPATWRQNLEKHFDVETFLRWLAVNTAIAEWDAYGQMAHNYYLYANPTNGSRFTWIHWDHNEALGNRPKHPPGMRAPEGAPHDIPATSTSEGPSPTAMPDRPPPPMGHRDRPLDHSDVTERWPLIRFLLDDPTYRARYQHHLGEITAKVFVPEHVSTRARALHALLAPALRTDEERKAAVEDIETLIEFVSTRATKLQEFVRNGP